ncbi:MAG TPA: rhodanese-like domain-containing protein [Xanthobacteraceae bacterium]|nr:rhodanese-like domain-containing protein [Xanthobacteraceae bacterium]
MSPRAVKAMLADGDELALLDVREELIFSRGHLLHARSLPLSRLELRIRALVPRRSTRIVLVDDGDDLAQRAAERLARLGYTDVAVLDGGVAGWTAAGCELFSGINVPSKAFGEFVEHADRTPNIGAEELEKLLRERANVVVLDSRPFDEYSRMSIPTGIDVPGAELVLRARDLAPSPETTIVVNCAGRTRSIIGAQSLINAGVPNKVVALRNGTMGWNLAGFTCDSGQTRRAPHPSGDALAWARSAAARVADRFGAKRIEGADLERLRGDPARTLYVFDVRDPEEYAAGHVAGSVSAPGGQLVQATDHYVGTLDARIVLVDEKEVRALMTGSWLRQMGFRDVFVLAQAGEERGSRPDEVPGLGQRPELAIDPTGLADLVARGAATVIDLSLSRTYRRAHIPGAWFAIRARLKQALAVVPAGECFVLTSEDGRLADLAAPELAALTERPVRYLNGGNAAWQAAGRPLTADGANMADEPIDVWLRPYERAGGVSEAMVEYLTWETDLPERIARDGTADFTQFRP